MYTLITHSYKCRIDQVPIWLDAKVTWNRQKVLPCLTHSFSHLSIIITELVLFLNIAEILIAGHIFKQYSLYLLWRDEM